MDLFARYQKPVTLRINKVPEIQIDLRISGLLRVEYLLFEPFFSNAFFPLPIVP